MSKRVPFWHFWDTRSGIVGGMRFSLVCASLGFTIGILATRLL